MTCNITITQQKVNSLVLLLFTGNVTVYRLISVCPLLVCFYTLMDIVSETQLRSELVTRRAVSV